MKKITQNLTNLKAWQSTIFAFMFLFSLTINAQEVGQEYLVNPGINSATGANSTTPETGVDGGGNFPANLGGWGGGTGGAFASASTANGDCHSADRMFKFFKVGGADGQYVNQTITALPAGNYNWSFFTKWGDAGHSSGPTGTTPGNLPSWSAEGDNQPKFTILVQDAEGAWVADQQNVTTEPTTVLTWVEDSGTWTNTETRDVRIKFAKNGGTAADGGSNTDKLMYIDDASLAYASGLTSSTESIPWSDDLEIDLSNFTTGQVGDTDANWAVTTARANSGAQSVFHDDANAASGYDNYLLTPTFDLSGATAPLLTYWDNVNYTTYAEAHEVLVSEDFTNDVATATWTVLNSTIGTEDTWVENEFALPISATVTVAFRYTGDYAS